VHLDLKCPLYSEVSGPTSCQFAIKQFRIAGQTYVNPDYFYQYRDMVWDATGSTTPPLMVGDPGGLKVYTGHVTMDPAMPTPSPVLHGWFVPHIFVSTFLDNGDSLQTRALLGFYSMRDPSAPEVSSYPLVSCRSEAHSSRRPEKAWGTTFAETGQFLPIVPISAPWDNVVSTARYGGINPEAATLDLRADLDLHMGVPGRVLFTTSHPGDLNEHITLEPAVLGPGTHKVAYVRTQPDAAEMVASLLVIDVTVGDAPPPVSTCTDPQALNVGGSLPCTFPPPPPPPPDVWVTIASLGGVLDVQKFGALEVFRVCVGTKCTTEFPITR